jgi:hypothetical protein
MLRATTTILRTQAPLAKLFTAEPILGDNEGVMLLSVVAFTKVREAATVTMARAFSTAKYC